MLNYLDDEISNFEIAVLGYSNLKGSVLTKPPAELFMDYLSYDTTFNGPHNLGVEYACYNGFSNPTLCFALHENLLIDTKDRTVRFVERVGFQDRQENPILPDGSFNYEGINGKLLSDREVRQLVRKRLPEDIQLIGATVNTPDRQVGLYTPYKLSAPFIEELYQMMRHKYKWLDLTKIFPFPLPM